MATSLSKVLVVSDYDRTLAHEKNGFFLDERVKRRVENFIKVNFFAVVSGRERRLMELFAKGFSPSAWVLENGALIFLDEKEVVNAPPCWFSLREKVSSLLEDMGIPYSLGKVIVYINNRELTPEEVSSLSGMCDVEYNRGDAMLLPKGVNKASGVSKLRELLHFDGLTVGVGDGENDLKMMSAVDIKVAVKNAVPCIKDIADIVLSREDGEGVVELLDMIERGELNVKKT